MSYIETSDILIRDINKKYLQINYDLDGVIKIISVDIIINGNEYSSTYYNFNFAFFDLSFLNNNNTYECNIRIKFIANDTYIIDNYGNELMTDNGQYIVVDKLSSNEDITYNILTEDEYLVITENNSDFVVTENAIEIIQTEEYEHILSFTSEKFIIKTKFITK